jgi:hypothetical protein
MSKQQAVPQGGEFRRLSYREECTAGCPTGRRAYLTIVRRSVQRVILHRRAYSRVY